MTSEIQCLHWLCVTHIFCSCSVRLLLPPVLQMEHCLDILQVWKKSPLQPPAFLCSCSWISGFPSVSCGGGPSSGSAVGSHPSSSHSSAASACQSHAVLAWSLSASFAQLDGHSAGPRPCHSQLSTFPVVPSCWSSVHPCHSHGPDAFQSDSCSWLMSQCLQLQVWTNDDKSSSHLKMTTKMRNSYEH